MIEILPPTWSPRWSTQTMDGEMQLLFSVFCFFLSIPRWLAVLSAELTVCYNNNRILSVVYEDNNKDFYYSFALWRVGAKTRSSWVGTAVPGARRRRRHFPSQAFSFPSHPARPRHARSTTSSTKLLFTSQGNTTIKFLQILGFVRQISYSEFISKSIFSGCRLVARVCTFHSRNI